MDRNAAAGTRQVVASAVVTLSNAKQNRPLLAPLGLTAISLAGLLVVPPIPQRSELSPVRRSAHFAQHTKFLECRFKSSLYRGRRGGTVTISSPSSNHHTLSGNIFDWLWFVLLSLESE